MKSVGAYSPRGGGPRGVGSTVGILETVRFCVADM